MDETKYTVKEIINAMLQADKEIIKALQYRDGVLLEDVLKDYLNRI